MRLYRPVLVCVLLVSLFSVAAGQDRPLANDPNGDPLPPGAVARLGSVRFGHDANVVFAAFLPDGKRVVSVSQDGVLCAWEFPSGKQLQRVEMLTGSAALMTNATLSPDGKHLTAFGDDGFLRIWDWAKGKELGKVAQVGNLPKASTSTSPFSKALTKSAATASGQVYSPDSKTLLLFGGSRKLQFVDLAAGKEIGASLGHTEPLVAIWFTPDGKQILTKDARVTHTWNAAKGTHEGALFAAPPAIAGTPTIISPDGKVGVTVARFASPAKAQAAKVREAHLFDTATGKVIGEIGLAVEIAPTHRKPLLFSPDGKLLAASAGDAQVKIDLYEVPSGKLLRSLGTGALAPGGKGFKAAVPASSQRMMFSPDNKMLAFQSAPGDRILVLDTESGKQIAAINPPEDSRAMQGAFSPDGRCLALEQVDGKVTLYELATGQARCTLDSKLPPLPPDKAEALAELLGGGGFGGGFGGGPFSTSAIDKTRVCIAFAPNGQLLALPGERGSVQIWDVLDGKVLTLLKGHTATVNALAFAPGGKRLASASDDTTALLWDASKIARPVPVGNALKPGDLDNWWQALTDNDSARAFTAMRDFAATPKEAVAWLKSRIKPVAPLDMKQVIELLKQLDSEKFAVRDRATAELLKMGEPLLPVLDKAMAGETSPEARLRLEQLRAKLGSGVLQGERLRDFRIIELLEFIGTAEARQLLQALADGAPGTLITTSAQAALKR